MLVTSPKGRLGLRKYEIESMLIYCLERRATSIFDSPCWQPQFVNWIPSCPKLDLWRLMTVRITWNAVGLKIHRFTFERLQNLLGKLPCIALFFFHIYFSAVASCGSSCAFGSL